MPIAVPWGPTQRIDAGRNGGCRLMQGDPPSAGSSAENAGRPLGIAQAQLRKANFTTREMEETEEETNNQNKNFQRKGQEFGHDNL